MNKCPETVYKKIKAINKQGKHIRFNCPREQSSGRLRGGRLSTRAASPTAAPIHASCALPWHVDSRESRIPENRMSFLWHPSDQVLTHNPSISRVLIFCTEKSLLASEFTLHFCFPKLLPAFLC